MNRVKNISFTFLFFISFTGCLYAQDKLPDEHILYLEITNGDKSKIEKSDRQLYQANILFKEAYELYDTNNTETWNPANKKMEEAIKIYDEAISSKYDVYDKYIQKFLDGLSGYYYDELDRAKYYENKANNYFREARLNKKKVTISEGFYEEFEEYSAAFHNEMLAILNMGRSLRIYQDWPVQYDYEWDDYKRSVPKEHPSYMADNTNEEDKDTVKVVVYDTVLVIIKDTLRMNDERITFRVQIAAHHNPLTKQYLRTIYKGGKKIFMIQEEGWYKYSIGSYFTDLEDAQRMLNSCNVYDAFITGYQYGQKLEYKEAVRRYNIQKNNYN